MPYNKALLSDKFFAERGVRWKISMDASILINILFQFWWLIPFFLIASLMKTPWFKGFLGELFIRIAAKIKLPSDIYFPIHNVTLPTLDGTTQIDHIFVSNYGIFVVETKNMTGWIFGSSNQSQWTQRIYKKSYKFQNPLRQNYKHQKAIEQALDVPPESIHSVIAFVGGSTFKTAMPTNVTSGSECISYILSFKSIVLNEAQINAAVSQIQSGRLRPGINTNLQHVQQLNTRSDITSDRKCPKCGSSMIIRTVKKGKNIGKKFWGCSTFPKCRLVQNVT